MKTHTIPLGGRTRPTSITFALVAVLAVGAAVLVTISRDDAVNTTAAQQVLTRPAGPASRLAGYEVTQSAGTAPAFGSARVWTSCSSGKKPIGGGIAVTEYNLTVLDSMPFDNGWTGQVKNVGSFALPFTVYAICATVSLS